MLKVSVPKPGSVAAAAPVVDSRNATVHTQAATDAGATPLARRCLASGVLLLMLLLASAPARNHELWLHLGLGKALGEGRYVLGADPLLQSPPAYWANPAWLTEFVADKLFDWFGGFGLILVKAAALTWLAWLLVSLSGFANFPWLATVTTLLAVVALGPWLAPRPSLVSYLFLGLFLVFLEKQKQRADAKEAVALTSYWPLWCLQILWVNCDDWFVLGPAIVGSYALAGAWRGLSTKSAQALLLAFGGIFLACLASPHHVHALKLPTALGFFEARAVLEKAGFGDIVVAPLQSTFLESGQLRNPGVMATFLLAGGLLLSFAFNARRVRLVDVFVGLFFLGLALWTIRALPFFVIATAPIFARNLRGISQRILPTDGPRQSRALGSLQAYGRFLIAVTLLALLVTAWPGWLQGHQEPRRWTVAPDDSLAKAARTIGEWRRTGKLEPEARGLNLTSDIGSYFAYFAPGERMFFDARLSALSAKTARELAVARRGFVDSIPAQDLPAWRTALRSLRIGYVVIQAREPARAVAALARCFQNPEEWPLLYHEGPTLIFGWRDPAAPDPLLARLRVDPLRWATHAPPERRAPPNWSGHDAEPPSWWSMFNWAPGDGTQFAQEADIHLLHYDAVRPVWQHRNLQCWRGAAAASIFANAGQGAGFALAAGLPASGFFSLDPPRKSNEKPSPAQTLAMELGALFLSSLEESPPEVLLLAIRSARRGIEADPRDPRNYLSLAEAYLRLAQVSTERGVQLTSFPHFRRLQATVAMHQALALNPDVDSLHVRLADVYKEQNHWDLALHHGELFRDSREKAGRLPGETVPQFNARCRDMASALKALGRIVDRQRRELESRSRTLSQVNKAVLAAELGLSKLALELLVAADPETFDSRALLLELKLMYLTGRGKVAREAFDPKDALSPASYLRFKTEEGMVVGDYANALKALATLTHGEKSKDQSPITLSDTLARTFGTSVLGHAHQVGLATTIAQLPLDQGLVLLVDSVVIKAEAHTLAGLLALEAGNASALAELAQAKALWLNVRQSLGGRDPPALHYVEGWLRKLTDPNR